MPQALTPGWYEMLAANAMDVHAEWLHTMGNLTLTGYNPEFGNQPYAGKRTTFALSRFELKRYFGDHERWGPIEIENRARDLFRIALQLWPRPEVAAGSAGSPVAAERSVPAAFRGDCVKSAQKHLGVHLSKLSQRDMTPAMVGFG